LSGGYGSWELQGNGTIFKQTGTRDISGYIDGGVIYWTVDYITTTKLRIKRVIIVGQHPTGNKTI